MSHKVRSIVVALVLIVTTTAAAQAFPLTARPAIAERGDYFGLVLDWVGSLFIPSGSGLTSIWQRAGSDMDPNGQPASQLPGPTTNAGSQMDPNG